MMVLMTFSSNKINQMSVDELRECVVTNEAINQILIIEIGPNECVGE